MRRAAIANTIGVLTLVLAGCGADSVSPSLVDEGGSPVATTTPSGTTGVSSESIALLESGFDACALLDIADVEAVTGRSVSEASEHLTGVPLEDIRDCVFFGERVGDSMTGIAGLSVRQVATSAAEGEALLAELAEGYPSGEVVGGHLADGVPDLEIRHCDPGNLCYSWLAFSAEPYFIIVRAGDIGEAETLAHAVLQRLTGN